MLSVFILLFVFFFKQKTAYEMRISDWSSDVCSSDLAGPPIPVPVADRIKMPVLVPFQPGLSRPGLRDATAAADAEARRNHVTGADRGSAHDALASARRRKSLDRDRNGPLRCGPAGAGGWSMRRATYRSSTPHSPLSRSATSPSSSPPPQ